MCQTTAQPFSSAPGLLVPLGAPSGCTRRTGVQAVKEENQHGAGDRNMYR